MKPAEGMAGIDGLHMREFGLLHIGGTAVNAALKANNKLGVGQAVKCYAHKTGLRDIVEKDRVGNVMFFIREPVSRYISAFNSRLRMGYPRHQGKWSTDEEIAFGHFKTPNELAEALSSGDVELRENALHAMTCIRHLKRAYEHYLGSTDLLEQEIDRIYFIGATEHLESDFSLMRTLLGVSPDIEMPTDDYGAHRTPDGFERTVSELGRRNVMDYYKTDYDIYDWCVKRREALIPIRAAEAAAMAA